MRRASVVFVVVVLGTFAGLAPRLARACGGFFCSSSPIDQAKERIVYGMEADGSLTMSVEIAYQGDDDDFAWIVPVPAPPEVSLGTEAIFDALDQATTPIFVTDDRLDGTCRVLPHCVYAGGATAHTGDCGFSAGEPTAWSGGYVDAAALDAAPAGRRDAGLPDQGVRVFSQSSIGPYDTVVLGSTSAAEVVRWLGEHGYDVPTGALPLLEPYAAQGHVFVALRLSPKSDSHVLRPIVLHMAAEACLPIRLTAIATVPSLPITAYFLGRAPVTSRNFSVAEVDASDPSFWTDPQRYQNAVADAVDAAGGRAFVTDYAGPTPAVTVELPTVTDLATMTDPAMFLRALQQRGYAGDALLLEILTTYLEPPGGGTPRDYYNCLTSSSTTACGQPTGFDPAALATAIDTQITQPRADAQALVQRHGQLTRLFTTMRASAMTVDPDFVQDEGLPGVSNVHHATLVTECSAGFYADDAPQHWEIGDQVFPGRAAGAAADDVAYCHRYGAYVAGMEPESSDSSSGCRVGGRVPLHGGAIVAAIVLLVVRRRRKKTGVEHQSSRSDIGESRAPFRPCRPVGTRPRASK